MHCTFSLLLPQHHVSSACTYRYSFWISPFTIAEIFGEIKNKVLSQFLLSLSMEGMEIEQSISLSVKKFKYCEKKSIKNMSRLLSWPVLWQHYILLSNICIFKRACTGPFPSFCISRIPSGLSVSCAECVLQTKYWSVKSR